MKLLLSSEAMIAWPVNLAVPGARRMVMTVPEAIRLLIDARVSLAPMDSKCLATISSGVILSAANECNGFITATITNATSALRNLVLAVFVFTLFSRKSLEGNASQCGLMSQNLRPCKVTSLTREAKNRINKPKCLRRSPVGGRITHRVFWYEGSCDEDFESALYGNAISRNSVCSSFR